MACQGRIISEYSEWKPLPVPSHFLAALGTLSGHVGHLEKWDWNRGEYCQRTSAGKDTQGKNTGPQVPALKRGDS